MQRAIPALDPFASEQVRMSDQFQNDGGIGMHPGAAESSFDLAVDAICDLVEGDGAAPPPEPANAPVLAKEEESPLAPAHAATSAADAHVDTNIASTQPANANDPISKKPIEGEVYINKNGKKVRRVKRSEKRMRQKQLETTDAAPAIEASTASVPTDRGAALLSNQKAQNEAEAQRAAAAAASAALLGMGALAAPSTGSDSQAIPDNVSSTNMSTPTLSFDRDPNSTDYYSTNNDEDGDNGDWDLDYKTGLAKQHEDAERQMLEGEEGRRGFESTDDEDDYDDEDDEEDGTMTGEYTNDPETASPMDGTSLADVSAAHVGIAASSNSNPMEAEITIPNMSVEPKNPFDEQLKVSSYDPMADVPLPPIEDPPPINQDTVAEDVVLDPGDIRAALSSASGGGHDVAVNQFDPLHDVAQGPSAQPNAHGTLSEISTMTPPLQQHQILSSANNVSSSYPERHHFEEITTASQGPLWRQAGMTAAAAERQQQQYHQFDPQQGKMTKRAAIEQTIRDECWSRAAVDSGEVAPDTLLRARSGGHTAAGHSETERVATRRVNVIQLLINGLIGLVGGLLGSIYVQTGCHFVTVDVGLSLHFGLWQYSPMDSALQGFTYCYPYDEDYTHDSPTFARICGFIALISGLFSLSVLWIYLLLSRTSNGLWKWAVRFLVVAASFQALTFSFFADAVCRRNSCSFGPGSIVSLISTLSWALIAYEMRENSPMATALISDPHLEADDMTNQDQGGMGLTGYHWYRPPVGLGVNV